ncbi:MAG: hypothetical protein IJV43_06960 [Oscillospiraceae bacterium]|nr:hypothetical protein [Oscillospiraceae bacterium]MBQ9719260.1 hypothetical protein [Oscillospiraceae bacterium]
MSEERLLQRLEDLNGRLAELAGRLPQSRMDEQYDRRFYARLTGEAAEAVIPAHLYTIEDVLTAIERAKAKLDDLRRERQLAAEQLAAEAIPGQLMLAGFAGAELKLAS